VNRAFSRERVNLTQSSDGGLGVCILAHSTEHLWRVQLLWILVKELEAPVMGAEANHYGGYARDEDACSSI
jgi:hypothetical protein